MRKLATAFFFFFCFDTCFHHLMVVTGRTGAVTNRNKPMERNVQVGIKHRPKDCRNRSQRGQYLTVHYNATIYQHQRPRNKSNERKDKRNQRRQGKDKKKTNQDHDIDIDPTTNKVVDSSYDRETPFRFRLGHRQVIPGLEQGLYGMCVGELRRLVIPPALAYGSVGANGRDIPADVTLVYTVQLLSMVEPDTPEGQQLSRTMWMDF